MSPALLARLPLSQLVEAGLCPAHLPASRPLLGRCLPRPGPAPPGSPARLAALTRLQDGLERAAADLVASWQQVVNCAIVLYTVPLLHCTAGVPGSVQCGDTLARLAGRTPTTGRASGATLLSVLFLYCPVLCRCGCPCWSCWAAWAWGWRPASQPPAPPPRPPRPGSQHTSRPVLSGSS